MIWKYCTRCPRTWNRSRLIVKHLGRTLKADTEDFPRKDHQPCIFLRRVAELQDMAERIINIGAGWWSRDSFVETVIYQRRKNCPGISLFAPPSLIRLVNRSLEIVAWCKIRFARTSREHCTIRLMEEREHRCKATRYVRIFEFRYFQTRSHCKKL